MKTSNDVQSPYTDQVVPTPTGASPQVVKSGGMDLGPGTVKESSHQAGPTATTFTPQGGASIPGKLDGISDIQARKYHTIPADISKP